MHQSLALFQTAHDMARHAGARQALTAQNVAQADTPGYVARHLPAFADSVQTAPGTALRATRPSHLNFDANGRRVEALMAGTEPAPNGNAVSVEEEMMHAINIAREHGRALTIYRHAMTVLRTSLGR